MEHLNNAENFLSLVEEEIAKIKQLMLETWGVSPDITLNVEPRLVIKADFNIKGFQHDGRNIHVKGPDMINPKKAKQAAQEIAREIVDHRNSCGECGEGIAEIGQRLYYVKAKTTNEPVWAETAAKRENIELPTGHTLSYDVGLREYITLNATLEPDAVEMYLKPNTSKKLLKLLENLPNYERAEPPVCQMKR